VTLVTLKGSVMTTMRRKRVLRGLTMRRKRMLRRLMMELVGLKALTSSLR
jgi:hypothetical protein